MIKLIWLNKYLMDSCTIRYAKKSDAKTIADLYLKFANYHIDVVKAFKTDELLKNIKKEVYNHYLKESIPHKNLLVAEVDCKVVGFCELDKIQGGVAHKITGDLALKDKNAVYISDVYVADEYQGLGIGKKFLKKVEEIRKERGMKRIELLTYINNTKAINFFTKRGFKPVALVMMRKYNK